MAPQSQNRADALDVNPAGTNHNLCTERLVNLHSDPNISAPTLILLDICHREKSHGKIFRTDSRTTGPPTRKSPPQQFSNSPGHFPGNFSPYMAAKRHSCRG